MLGLLLFSFSVEAAEVLKEKTKEVKNSFRLQSGIKPLYVSNSFGSVHAVNWEKDEILCEVQVKVATETDRMSEELLDAVAIVFKETSERYEIETKTNISPLRRFTNDRQKLEINIQLYVPEKIPLNISNKYGNVTVQSTMADFNCNVNYGEIRIDELKGGKNLITSRYGAVQVGSVTDADFTIQYSGLSLRSAGCLIIDSQYSDIEVEETGEIQGRIRYGNLKAGKVDRTASLSVDYANVTIQDIRDRLALKIKFGQADISVSNDRFSEIDIESSYSGVTVDVPETSSFKTDLSTKYANITISEKLDHSNLSIEKDNTDERIFGTIGKDKQPVRSIRVKNLYNNITIR